jgi:outer membrane cobalamin receptor
MIRAGLIAALAGVTVATASKPVRADVELEGLLEQPVVTTASKTAESASAAPGTTSSISAEDLRRHGIRSLAEALNFLGLGTVASPGSDDLGARGVTLVRDFGSHYLILVDGHVINDQHEASALFTRAGAFPVEIIDHIEIVLGPGSVLYGGNAMLGVVNVVTKRAKDFGGVHVIAENSFVAPVDRDRDLRSPSLDRSYLADLGLLARTGVAAGVPLELFGTRGGLVVQTQVVRNERQAYELGAGRWRPFFSDSTNPNGYARLVLGRFEASFYGSWAQTAERGRNFPNTMDGAQGAPGEGSRTQRYALDLRYRESLSPSAELSVRLFADSSRNERNTLSYEVFRCPQGMSQGCVTQFGTRTAWLGAELQGTYDWSRDGSQTTLVGVIGQVRQIGLIGVASDAVTGASTEQFLDVDQREGAGAVYAQHVAKLHRRLTANVGARFDYEQRFGQRLSPRAALVWNAWAGGALKLVYSEAFRGPTAVESFYQDRNNQLLSRDLSAESVRSGEVSVEQSFGRMRLLYGLFYTRWSDLVRLRPYFDTPFAPPEERAVVSEARRTGQVSANQIQVFRFDNVDSIQNYGMNVGVEGTVGPSALGYGANLVVAQARTSNGAPLEDSPRLVGNARLTHPIGASTLGFATSVIGAQRAVSAVSERVTLQPDRPLLVTSRMTLSGPFLIEGMTYRVMAQWAFARTTATTAPTPIGIPMRELNPAERLTVMLGLQYDL